ncbi:hypothetical protein [Sulfurimonas sp.]|uniref:hypothetical protein n=1 Tax=Sulfurimonas sp. TaxID=2022749 RepID=UPI002B483235|nr:hypothetical protein [Sulfurimonas sp.]
MKKYMILIFLLFVSLSLQANTPKINECINDIYFANSIMTSEEDAKYKLRLIEKNILLEKYDGNVTKMKKELNFKTSYNQTHGYYGDIYDTYMLLSLEEDGWDTYTTIMKLVLTRGLSKATNLAGKIAKLSKKEKELFDKIVDDLGGTNYLDIYSVDRSIDLSKQINDYKKSIRLGHGIIIVAHGKGDIFTAKAYEDMLKPEGNRDNAWLEDYISWMSVGSPTREARGFHPYINFDNDKVADQGTLDATTNPNRSYMLNAVNEYTENSSDMQFHAFDYYMGQNISFEDGYGRRDISTDIGKKVIMDFLSSSIKKHKNASSQWATDQEIEKGTKNYRITVKHLHDPNVVMSEDVYPFAVAKKLYHVTDNTGGNGWVKASCGGSEVFDDWTDKTENEFYKLEGTDPVEYIESDCDISQIPTPKRGVVNVQLTWSDSNTDMNLEVDMPFGSKDIENVCLPIEHFSVLKQEDVEVGVYKVFVRNTQGFTPSTIPQEVHLAIDTPSSAVTFDFNITAVDMLNLGHVADIVISEKKEVTFVSKRTSNPPKVTHYARDDGSSRSYTTYIQQYVYKIISRLKQGLLGPLSNAEVNIYDANNTDDSLYTTRTTGGNSALTAGVIHFPSDVLNTLKDDKYYVVSIFGGDDIDVNDDGVVDASSTPNGGTIRAIIKGNKLKRDNFKVNILSEAIYQLSKDILNQDTTSISQRIENLTKRLLLKDIDGNNIINYEDILYWLPMYNKNKLLKDYNSNYEPVVQKIYKDEDIYDDVYAIAYEIFLNPQTLHVKENSIKDTIVGEIHVALLENNATFSIQGDGSNKFSIDDEGVVRVEKGVVLDYESKNIYDFNLSVTTDTQTLSVTLRIKIDNELDAPELSGSASYIDENSEEDTYVGKLHVNKGLSEIITIELQGDGNENFKINNIGVISVTKDALLDYESKRVYDFKVVASNEQGKSLPTSVYVYLNNLLDAPTLQPISLKTKENSSIGTQIGTLSMTSEGDIESISLSGEGNEDFSVDLNGTISVAKTLNYSTKSNYALQAVATNAYGSSKSVSVSIKIIGTIKPFLLGSYTSSYANGVTLSKDGTVAFVTDGGYGLQIIDVSNPRSPLRLVRYRTPGRTQGVTLSKDGTVAFVLDESTGLEIIDVSNPRSPFYLVRYDTPGEARGVTLSKDGTVAFVADGGYGLQIIDVTNPSSPLLLGSYDIPYYVTDVTLSKDGTAAFVVAGSRGLQIIDVSNPRSPSLLGSYDTPGHALGVTLSKDGTVAFVADYNSLQIIDVSKPSSPALLGSYDTPGEARGVTLSKDGTVAFVVDGPSGLQIIDVSNTSSPSLLGSYDTPGHAWNVTLSKDGTVAFVADGDSLQIIDVSFSIK